MRVSTKALAPLSALLFFASCVTPPPMVGSSRPIVYGEGQGRSDRRPYAEAPYEAPSEGRRLQRERAPQNEYVREPEYRVADSWSDRRADERRQDGRFDDGRYAIPRGGVPRSASYSAEPTGQSGYYDDRFVDAGPPHERVDYVRRPGGRLSFQFGRRRLIDDAFQAADNPFAFGVEYSQAVEPGTLGLEVGFAIGRDEADNAVVPSTANFSGGIFDLERDMAEIYAGFRTEFGHSNIRPYIGGGGTLINMSEHRSQGFLEAESDDNTVGAYLHGGVQMDLNEVLFLGVDFRRVFGSSVELFEQKYETDYSQLSFSIGFSL